MTSLIPAQIIRRGFATTVRRSYENNLLRQVTAGVWTTTNGKAISSSSSSSSFLSQTNNSTITNLRRNFSTTTTSNNNSNNNNNNATKSDSSSSLKTQTRDFGAAGSAPKREKKAIMTVTPTAAGRVTELMQNDEACTGIRVSLRQRGCSGMSYVMDFQKDEPNKFDEVLDFVDAEGKKGKVIVDAQAVLFLVGTEMDYKEVEMGSEFVFDNPNEKGSCGCGQSFNV